MPHGVVSWHACRLLAVATLAISCERLSAPACPRNARALARADTPTSFRESDVFLQYFPSALILNRRPRRDEFLNRLSDFEASWFASKLIDYGEPSLAERASDPKAEAYRVLEMPSLRVFGDFSIRVERAGMQASLASKRSVLCENGREDGMLVAAQKYFLNDAAWLQLAACMDRSFWSAPLRDSFSPEDGVTTVFEGVRGGQHHVVTRSTLSDEEEAPDRQALARCRALLEAAAGWKASRSF
jgi:hypothetical protein